MASRTFSVEEHCFALINNSKLKKFGWVSGYLPIVHRVMSLGDHKDYFWVLTTEDFVFACKQCGLQEAFLVSDSRGHMHPGNLDEQIVVSVPAEWCVFYSLDEASKESADLLVKRPRPKAQLS